MKPIIVLLVLSLCHYYAYAQDLSQTIRGQLVDAQSQYPLFGANIMLLKDSLFLGAVTDTAGQFYFSKVPVGKWDLKVSYLGYEDLYIPALLVGSGKEVVLNLDLTESVVQLEELVIHAQRDGEPVNDMAVISANSFSIEQSERFAGSIGDPARLVQSFAGVSMNSDVGNEIVVRGNAPKGLLWRLEGIEIPNPNHFASEGGGGGGISLLSNNVLSRSDFFTSAFPAEYGNAMSGVFDLSMRNGNTEKREYTLQLGLIGIDAALEGPFIKGKPASYLVNYRFSTLTLIRLLGYNIRGQAYTNFQDINFKLYFPTNKLGQFSLFGIGGLSGSIEPPTKPSEEWDDLTDAQQNEFHYNMGVVGLSHKYILNPKSYIHTTASFDAYQVLYQEGYLDINQQEQFEPVFDDRVNNYSFRINSQMNHKLSAKHHLRYGAIFQQLYYDAHVAFMFPEIDSTYTKHQSGGNTALAQAYLQWKYRISPDLTLHTGVHSLFFLLNQSYSIEPRIGLKWQLHPKLAINVGAGLHSRLEPLATYLNKIDRGDTILYRNADLELTKARHLVVGSNYRINNYLQCKVEGYYQSLYDIPADPRANGTYSLINKVDGYSTRNLENIGLGRNYGLELTLEKYLHNAYYFLSNISLFESKYLAGDGIWRSTKYNSNFVINFTGGKDFQVGKHPKSNWISLNTKLFWGGGRRVHPIDLAASRTAGRTISDDNNAFADQVANYFRIDLGFVYRKNKPNYAWAITLDILNLTNRKNELRRYYAPETDSIESRSQLGIIPVLRYRIEL